MYRPQDRPNFKKWPTLASHAEDNRLCVPFQTDFLPETDGLEHLVSGKLFKTPEISEIPLGNYALLEAASSEVASFEVSGRLSRLKKVRRAGRYAFFYAQDLPLSPNSLAHGAYFARLEDSRGNVFFSEVFAATESSLVCTGEFLDGDYPNAPSLVLSIRNDNPGPVTRRLSVDWSYLVANTFPLQFPVLFRDWRNSVWNDSAEITVPGESTLLVTRYFGGQATIEGGSVFDVPRNREFSGSWSFGACSGGGDWKVASAPVIWSNFRAEQIGNSTAILFSATAQNTTNQPVYWALNFSLVGTGIVSASASAARSGTLSALQTLTITATIDPLEYGTWQAFVTGHYEASQNLLTANPPPAFFGFAGHVFGGETINYLDGVGSLSNWHSVEVIPSYSPSFYPAAELALDTANRRLTVARAGYICGFRIKNGSGTVIVEAPVCEGLGTGNDILHNVLSTGGATNYENHFRISGAVLSQFWVDDVPRTADPFAVGYSVEALGGNIVTNSECDALPTAGTATVSYNCVASIVSGRLQMVNTNDGSSTFASYNIGGGGTASAQTYTLPSGFYKVSGQFVSETGDTGTQTPGFVLRTAASIIVAATQTTGPGTYTHYINPTAAWIFRLLMQGTNSVTVWDNLYAWPVTNRLFFGAKRPPHATLAGKDASNFNLTNPA